tara:strand:+ start:304 stop:483 length:180 start_codon:yes stop_codon:yes gene_type:complete
MLSEDPELKDKSTMLKNLEILSIEALLEYINELRNEISRAEAMIREKELAREKANKFFE